MSTIVDIRLLKVNDSSVFCICLFGVTLSEDDLKKLETCRSVTELCAEVCL
jgi:hypothetical protein